MKTENKTTLWDFLEANMTNYSQDERICRIDRLDCFLGHSLSDDEIAENDLICYSDNNAYNEIIRLTDECFAEAMENFTKKSKLQIAFETMLKGDKVRVTEQYLFERNASDLESEMIIRSVESDGLIALYSEEQMDVLYDVTIDDIEFIL